MTTVTYCDRCGAALNGRPLRTLDIYNEESELEEVEMDLCPPCAKATIALLAKDRKDAKKA